MMIMVKENKNKEKIAAGRGFKGSRIFFAILAAFLGLAAILTITLLSPVASEKNVRETVVDIPVGATAGQVGKILKQNSLVRSSLGFTLYCRWKGLDGQIKAGEYLLSNGLSTPDILRELVDGRLAVQTFTVPEGFTSAQIADLLASMGLADRERFFEAAAGGDFPYSFLRDLPKDRRRLEGYLFPDTYQVARGSSEASIIDMMLRRFEKEMNDLDYHTRAGRLGLTLHQAVTVASMVEREAVLEEERPIIAGVIYNRMAMSMPLQIDATVQYAIGTVKPKIYYKDLEIDSPYNTYKNEGLPPGPIAMPGRSSLLAAVNPARTDYLYYVAKPDGSHAFARTLDEHNANKERYLQ